MNASGTYDPYGHRRSDDALAKEERSRLLEIAVRRADQTDDALSLALSRIADGWGFTSALAAVRAQYGSAASDALERQLGDVLLKHFGRR